MLSPSLRGSGLKYRNHRNSIHHNMSPSLRGSGLKFVLFSAALQAEWVSLFTREWIEIGGEMGRCKKMTSSPSLRGSGLKSPRGVYLLTKPRRLPLYEGVDWNKIRSPQPIPHNRLPLYEGVDWNHDYIIRHFGRYVVSLFTREWIEMIFVKYHSSYRLSLPLYEGVDWNTENPCMEILHVIVSLFTREWIEITNGIRSS